MNGDANYSYFGLILFRICVRLKRNLKDVLEGSKSQLMVKL